MERRWVLLLALGGRDTSVSVDAGMYYLPYMGILALLMAVWQQIEAHNPRGAQLMASLPVTRGRMLQAQLVSGLTILTAALAVYAVGCCLIAARYRVIFEISALASPIPGRLLEQLGSIGPLLMALRLYMTLVSAYLMISVLFGLFGNVLLSFGLLLGLGFWCVFLLDVGGQLSHQIHSLGLLRGVRFSAAFNLVGIGTQNSTFTSPLSHDYAVLPWRGLGWFASIHLSVWALCLFILWQQRRHLALERLGSFFLFEGSRWVVVGLMTMWVLPLPLLNLTVHDQLRNTDRFDPQCLLMLIPVALVFGLGYWLVVKRPKLRLNKRLAALALAMVLVLPSSMGKAEAINPERVSYGAEDHRIGYRYDADGLRMDEAWAERINRLCAMVHRTAEENLAALRKEQPGIAAYSGLSCVETPVDGDYREFFFAESMQWCFMNELLSATVDYTGITKAQMIDALRQCGFDKLALEYGNSGKSPGMVVQDGLWLQWLYGPSYDLGLTDDEIEMVTLYANTPLIVKAAEALDRKVLENANARRASSYSSGISDTVVYQFCDPSVSMTQLTGTVILRNARPWRMLLSFPAGSPEMLQLAQRAAKSMVAGSAAMGAVEANEAWNEQAGQWIARFDE